MAEDEANINPKDFGEESQVKAEKFYEPIQAITELLEKNPGAINSGFFDELSHHVMTLGFGSVVIEKKLASWDAGSEPKNNLKELASNWRREVRSILDYPDDRSPMSRAINQAQGPNDLAVMAEKINRLSVSYAEEVQKVIDWLDQAGQADANMVSGLKTMKDQVYLPSAVTLALALSHEDTLALPEENLNSVSEKLIADRFDLNLNDVDGDSTRELIIGVANILHKQGMDWMRIETEDIKEYLAEYRQYFELHQADLRDELARLGLVVENSISDQLARPLALLAAYERNEIKFFLSFAFQNHLELLTREKRPPAITLSVEEGADGSVLVLQHAIDSAFQNIYADRTLVTRALNPLDTSSEKKTPEFFKRLAFDARQIALPAINKITPIDSDMSLVTYRLPLINLEKGQSSD